MPNCEAMKQTLFLAAVLAATLSAPAVAQAQPAPQRPVHPVPAQTCKVFDSDGDEIWSGPCNQYLDTCTVYSPPSCPTVRCSGGEIGEVENGEQCLAGSAQMYQGGEPVESIEICYCDVPIGPLANPFGWALGFLLGLGMFRRRLA
jgi:hypothetical protein